MNMARFAAPGVLAPLQGLWRWFLPVTAPDRSTPAGTDNAAHEFIPHAIAQDGPLKRIEATGPNGGPAPRQLRVVRVLEVDQSPASVGRMLISGRMADVCAELERLAAREATLH